MGVLLKENFVLGGLWSENNEEEVLLHKEENFNLKDVS